VDTLISKLFLMSGRDFQISKSVAVKHPKMSDIMSINNGFMCEDYYWSYVYTLLSDPYDHMVYLDDKNLDYEEVTPFFVFALRWADANEAAIKGEDVFSLEMIKSALRFFFGVHDFQIVSVGGKVLLIDKQDPSWGMNDEIFTAALEFIVKMNCIERTDKIRPATPSAKKILIEDTRMEQRRKQRSKKKEKHTEPIGDALVAAMAGGVSLSFAGGYESIPIHPLLATSRAVQKKTVVQSMLNGIYTGMLKAEKLPADDLRWV